MIMAILDLISWIISLFIMIWIVLMTLKYLPLKNKKHKKYNKIAGDYLDKYNSFLKKLWSEVLWFLTVCISVFLAIGAKPIVYKLNFPLGEGYATFASYLLAILIYLMISKD